MTIALDGAATAGLGDPWPKDQGPDSDNTGTLVLIAHDEGRCPPRPAIADSGLSGGSDLPLTEEDPVATDGTDTNDPNAAVKGADGKPVASPLRNTAFQASALETSLWSSVLAFNVADLVVGLGAMIIVLGLAVGGVGVALGALAIPAMAREFHVDPVAARIRPK